MHLVIAPQKMVAILRRKICFLNSIAFNSSSKQQDRLRLPPWILFHGSETHKSRLLHLVILGAVTALAKAR